MSDWAATNTSFDQDSSVTGFRLNRTAGGRRLDTEAGTEPTATTTTSTTTKRKKTNTLGRGLTRFCRKIGIKPEYLFLSTLAFFSVLLAVVMLLSSALWAADRCMQMRRRAVSGGSAALPAKDTSISFVTLLGWRLQGLTLRACYYGFYAVSSSAVFQVFLQASASTPKPTTTPTTTSSSRVVPAAKATLAVTAVAVLAILVFFLIIFVGGALALRTTSKVDEPRTRVVVGTLVAQYKPSHRLFWLVRPVQILVTALAMALMSAAPTAQVAVLIAVHALSLIAVVVARPFNDTVHFLVAVVVEVTRLVCCALLLVVLESPSLGVELASILLNTLTIFLLCAVECVNMCGAMRRRLRGGKTKLRGPSGGGAEQNNNGIDMVDDKSVTFAETSGGSSPSSTPQHVNKASYLTSMEVAKRPSSASLQSRDVASSSGSISWHATMEGTQFVEYLDEHGTAYYYKASSGETAWALPELPEDLTWVSWREGGESTVEGESTAGGESTAEEKGGSQNADKVEGRHAHVPVVHRATAKGVYRATAKSPTHSRVTTVSNRHRGKAGGGGGAGGGGRGGDNGGHGCNVAIDEGGRGARAGAEIAGHCGGSSESDTTTHIDDHSGRPYSFNQVTTSTRWLDDADVDECDEGSAMAGWAAPE